MTYERINSQIILAQILFSVESFPTFNEDIFIMLYKFCQSTMNIEILIEEVSNHRETLALAGPGEALKSRRAT